MYKRDDFLPEDVVHHVPKILKKEAPPKARVYGPPSPDLIVADASKTKTRRAISTPIRVIEPIGRRAQLRISLEPYHPEDGKVVTLSFGSWNALLELSKLGGNCCNCDLGGIHPGSVKPLVEALGKSKHLVPSELQKSYTEVLLFCKNAGYRGFLIRERPKR